MLLALLLTPGAADGQGLAELRAPRLEPLTPGLACALLPPLTGPVWDAVLAPHASDRDAREDRLAVLRDSLWTLHAAAPRDTATLHRLVLVLGAQTDLQGGAGKVRAAEELSVMARRLLELDPLHAGAHHVLGRLHAGVRRMGRLQRFVATHLLGGGELAGASWEKARYHLETAAEQDPCMPDHLYELARLYVDVGDLDAAHHALVRLLHLPSDTPHAHRVREKALALMEDD